MERATPPAPSASTPRRTRCRTGRWACSSSRTASPSRWPTSTSAAGTSRPPDQAAGPATDAHPARPRGPDLPEEGISMSSTEFLQQLQIGIVSGSTIGLLGVSFALIIGVTQRFHVAYTATYLGAVYAGIWLEDHVELPIGFAVVFGLVIAAVLGLLIEGVVYRRIAARAAKR